MISKLVSDYMDYATVHGLGRLKNTPYWFLKVLWVLCLCASLGMITFQFYLLITKYQSQPISTNVEMKTPETTDFPVVTICNTNPLDYSRIPLNSSLQATLEAEARAYGIDIWAFKNEGQSNDSTELMYTNETVHFDHSVLYETTEKFQLAMNAYTYEELNLMTQPVTDFILTCSYNGQDCSTASIQAVRTFKYGLCYNIFPEYQHSQNNSRMVAVSGERYGLDLLLNVDEENGLPFVTQSRAVYVMVHKGINDSDYLYLSEGVIVPTGVDAGIQVSQVEKIRVSKGGGSDGKRCNDIPYTLTECIHSCQQMRIAQICQCYQYYHEFAIFNGNDSDYPACDTGDNYKCMRKVLASFASSVPDECSVCRVQCNERSFKTSTSFADWPSKNFMPVLKRILKVVWPEETNVTDEDVSNNLLVVRVYLSSMSYESITEDISYSDVNLASDIGGTLGLWAGFSILSLVEIFELIFLLCAKQVNKKQGVIKVEEAENGANK